MLYLFCSSGTCGICLLDNWLIIMWLDLGCVFHPHLLIYYAFVDFRSLSFSILTELLPFNLSFVFFLRSVLEAAIWCGIYSSYQEALCWIQ